MAGLCFKFVELIEELSMLKAIEKEFLDPATTWVLKNLESDLNATWSAAEGRLVTLELGALHTTPSQDYEIGNRRGGPMVYAVITGSWRVRPIDDNAKKGKRLKREKRRAGRLLEFCDIASTKVELYDAKAPKIRLGMWRMELGAEDHPGCYFHVHILGDSDEPPFPQTIPIPRLPSMFITPMGAIEYVLSELFQDKWAKAAARNVHEVQRWRTLQTERLKRLLEWYQKELSSVVSSPWVQLKTAKPSDRLFL